MRTALNIKTSPDIPVRHNARRINACIAQEIPVPHLVLIIKTDKVAAAVSHRHLLRSLRINKRENPPLVVRREHQLWSQKRASNRFEPDHAPGIDVHVLKYAVECV